jgi:hypothetical protein
MPAVRQRLRKPWGRDFTDARPRPGLTAAGYHDSGIHVSSYSSSPKTLYLVMRANQETNTISHADSIMRPQLSEPAIDATLQDSFPASDPPSWTLGVERPSPRSDENAPWPAASSENPL